MRFAPIRRSSSRAEQVRRHGSAVHIEGCAEMKSAASSGGTVHTFYCGSGECQHHSARVTTAVRNRSEFPGENRARVNAYVPADSCIELAVYCSVYCIRYDISCGGLSS